MLLELKNIKKYFPIKKGFFPRIQGYVKAVNDVNLSVAKGENLSLVGESGSGKTTLGRIILKLISPNSGEIGFNGTDVTDLRGHELRSFHHSVQMVFQDPFNSLDPRFTVRRIMLEALMFTPRLSTSQKIEKIQDSLSAVHLPKDILTRYPHEFSGGERQRIAIARALVMNPKLLILDEAVSSLDVLVQEEIINLLQEIQGQFDLTYLFISHNLRVVKKISSRIAVMYQGRIVEAAGTAELFNNPIHPYTQELLKAAIAYEVMAQERSFVIREDAKLVDNGQQHFVLES